MLNEMKTHFMKPENIFLEELKKNLYNETNYQFCAGGLPQDIIQVSFEEAVSFHKQYFSPSNCVVYSYGDLDFTKHLKYLN